MTNDEIRIAIAESLGWVWYRIPSLPSDNCQHRTLFHPRIHEYQGQSDQWKMRADGSERICNMEYMMREGYIPNYPADLNAIHEAVNTLSPENRLWFLIKLDRVTFGGPDFRLWFFDRIITATPRDWCEAYLRTIGKWKE